MFDWLLDKLFDKIAARRFARPERQRGDLIMEIPENPLFWPERDEKSWEEFRTLLRGLFAVYTPGETSPAWDAAKAVFKNPDQDMVILRDSGDSCVIQDRKTGKYYLVQPTGVFSVPLL
jgi:hypothetical protein